MEKSLSAKLLHQLRQTVNYIQRGMQNNMKENGMHQGQGRILFIISQNKGATQKELADKMGIRPSSISELLVKLESKGLIIKEQSDDDKRAQNIELTPEGLAIINKTGASKMKTAEDMLASLDTEEKEHLSILMDKLNSGLAARFGNLPASASHGGSHRHMKGCKGKKGGSGKHGDEGNKGCCSGDKHSKEHGKDGCC